jgi:chromosome segregation ATPase
MQWMNNTHWKEREELVKADISILKDKIKDNDTVIKALSANQEIEENIEIELRETKAKLKKVKQKLETSKGEAKRINEEYINLCTARKDASSKIADLDEQYERNEREIESYLEKRELKNSKRNEVIKLEKQLNSLEVEGNIKEANARLAELKSESKLLKERYTKMKANGNGLCPVLNEACDRVKFTKKDEKELADKRNEISQLINQCEEVIEDLYTKEDLERKIEKADTKYKELIDELNVKVTDKRKAIQKKIEKLEASLDNEVLDKYKELKNKWGDKIDELETLIALENNKIGTFYSKN